MYSGMETRVWWLKGRPTLDLLWKELERCELNLERAKEAFQKELEINGDSDDLIGFISNEQDWERKIDALKWDIRYWPRPI